MISFLKGRVLDLELESVTIDVQGVGYDVNCSSNTIAHLSAAKDAQLWIYTHVREDLILLCGFSTKAEKQLFQSLLKVNGIGPKMALKILSGAPMENIVQMIEDKNAKGLSQLPKVGKKIAEQMILTLKGKLVVEESVVARPVGVRQEVTSALVNLGFRMNDVDRALAAMTDITDVEEGIKRGLAALSSL